MKILSSPKILLGTIAATGLMTMTLNSCSKKGDRLSIKQAQVELNKAREQYKKDSIEFINSDSVKAKEKLAKLQNLKHEYYVNSDITYKELVDLSDALVLANKSLKQHYVDNEKASKINNIIDKLNTNSFDNIAYIRELVDFINGNKNLEIMDNAINDAQTKVDIATGNVLKRSKEKVTEANKNLVIEKILDKRSRGEKLTNADETILYTHNIGLAEKKANDANDSANKEKQIYKDILKNLNRISNQDSIMNEFKKIAAKK